MTWVRETNSSCSAQDFFGYFSLKGPFSLLVYSVEVFPYVELMAGCHLAKEDDNADRLQKGLRLRFLESHGLENIYLKKKKQGLTNLNSEEVTVLE